MKNKNKDKKRVVALATADLHTHNFRAFNDGKMNRLKNTLSAIGYITELAKKLEVPILLAGDLVHANRELENPVVSSLYATFKIVCQNEKVPVAAISGNHDFFTRNLPHESSPSYLDGLHAVFNNFHHLRCDSWTNDDIEVYGIPYFDNDLHLRHAINGAKRLYPKKLGILMLHSDMPGAKTPEGTQIDETENLPTHIDSMFEDWDLVIMGHIHLPQKLTDKVVMLGPPIHQDRSSIGHEFGYWAIYNDGEIRFRSLNDHFPCFVMEGDEAKKSDFIVPKDEPEELTEDLDMDQHFTVNTSSTLLVKRWFKAKNIKSKSKRRALIETLNLVR